MNESLKSYSAQYVYLYVKVPVADTISLVTMNHWWRDWVHGKIGSSARTPRAVTHRCHWHNHFQVTWWNINHTWWNTKHNTYYNWRFGNWCFWNDKKIIIKGYIEHNLIKIKCLLYFSYLNVFDTLPPNNSPCGSSQITPNNSPCGSSQITPNNSPCGSSQIIFDSSLTAHVGQVR